MVSAEAARNAVGIIGNVISFFLFLSPLPTFYRIIKNKDTQEFQFYPYVATVLNCMFWVFYGLPFVTKDNILVVTINGVGLGLELIYLAIFCFYDKQNKGRKRVAIGLTGEVIFTAVIVTITMLAFHTHGKRSLFVGVFCDAFNILMYSSPLLIMKKVIKTRSVEYMPLFLSLANFANGCIWTAYALIKLDVFILISNGVGALAGAAQLILYACYYKSTPVKEDLELDPVKPGAEIQLQKAKDIV
ncbi:bidirectional sugar transporter SWEET4-like [Euphorbia lathyris]|uniref:bidirectional sugar transporter SWEET4-like n=1 Tax=Euphorbia lathyris TaxID=212925 RepID=UPI0033143CA9